MTQRMDFIKQISGEGIPCNGSGVFIPEKNHLTDKIWAGLLHLSFNFALGIKNFGGIRTEFEP